MLEPGPHIEVPNGLMDGLKKNYAYILVTYHSFFLTIGSYQFAVGANIASESEIQTCDPDIHATFWFLNFHPE